MKKKYYLTLKIKLTVVITLLIGLISLFIYYYFPNKFEEERLNSLEEKAFSIAKIAAYGISSGLYFEDHQSSANEIEALIENEAIKYVVINKNDSNYYSYNSYTAVMCSYTNLEDDPVSPKWEILKSHSPIIINDEIVGDVYMGFSLTPIYYEISQLRKNIGLVSIVMFVLGVIIVFFMTHIFTLPLKSIVDTVRKIADGDLRQRVNIKGKNEVGFLANSINEMAEKIETSNMEMDRINKELETRVIERTSELEGVLKSLRKENLQRKKIESDISKSLHEKEVLLKEIHHRVKNNLQIVSSLFFFQSKQISDPKMLDMFRDGQNRVKSMALIHEKLYQSGDLANIDFREYVKKLTNFLFQSYGISQTKVKLRNNVQQVQLGVDTAVPCGLIINELISNSLKHGLNDSDHGEIKLDMGYDENNKLILKISDNGKGIPPDFKLEEAESLGLRLVQNLTTQLNGKVSFFNNNGTIVRIVFQNPLDKKVKNG